MMRIYGVLYILIWKYILCNNNMYFLDILNSKSGPRMVCFVYILISKCILRYTSVYFFNIVILKSGPMLR